MPIQIYTPGLYLWAMLPLSFHANGKLLLFGEYFVLDGCTAFAWPLRFGQRLEVQAEENLLPGLHWKSFNHKGELWFEAFYDKELNLLQSVNEEKAITLQKILSEAREANENFLKDERYHEARIYANYPSEWGLGSSSTLIHLIAQWAGIDAMDLFFSSFTGSGYDIACAGTSHPIAYTLRNGHASWKEITFPTDALIGGVFIYLGKKQDSREGITHYRRYRESNHAAGQELDDLVRNLLENPTRNEVMGAMVESENLIAQALELETVKHQSFPDFPGAIKSLGAWGGDFILALPYETGFDTRSYFQRKGYTVLFDPPEILL